MKRNDALAMLTDLLFSPMYETGAWGFQWGSHQVCGSLRRGCEEVGDADVVVDGDPEKTKQLAEKLGWQIISGRKGTKSISLKKGELQVDLMFSRPESWGSSILHFTGPMELNVHMRGEAVARGWKLNQWGLWQGDARIAGTTEHGVFEKLEMAYLTPFEREVMYKTKVTP